MSMLELPRNTHLARLYGIDEGDTHTRRYIDTERGRYAHGTSIDNESTTTWRTVASPGTCDERSPLKAGTRDDKGI